MQAEAPTRGVQCQGHGQASDHWQRRTRVGVLCARDMTQASRRTTWLSGRSLKMRAKARQQLEAQLQRLEHQRDDTKRKLRALVRQAQRERRYRYGEFVELAGLTQVDPGTLLGGLCALTTMLTDEDTASRWKGEGDALLADHHRRKGHRKRAVRPPDDGTTPPAISPNEQEKDT